MMDAAETLAKDVGVPRACQALGVSRATLYRRRFRGEKVPTPRAPSPRALSSKQRQAVRGALYSPAFIDKAPREVYAKLLDDGQYLCSVRTMYRILAKDQASRERRNQLRHPNYKKPELLATGPNQVWSWDINDLPE
jgi:putative transposase